MPASWLMAITSGGMLVSSHAVRTPRDDGAGRFTCGRACLSAPRNRSFQGVACEDAPCQKRVCSSDGCWPVHSAGCAHPARVQASAVSSCAIFEERRRRRRRTDFSVEGSGNGKVLPCAQMPSLQKRRAAICGSAWARTCVLLPCSTARRVCGDGAPRQAGRVQAAVATWVRTCRKPSVLKRAPQDNTAMSDSVPGSGAHTAASGGASENTYTCKKEGAGHARWRMAAACFSSVRPKKFTSKYWSQ